jgi:hypothetical protein
MTLSKDDLAAIAARADAATPGPWTARGPHSPSGVPAHVVWKRTEADGRVHTDFVADVPSTNRRKEVADAAFIAAARTDVVDLLAHVAELQAENERLKRELNTPEVVDFVKAVQLEAAHQRERWGTDYDTGKSDADWFWLVGYLAGKALHNPPCEKCGGSGSLDCTDPQCSDSTWDHACTAGARCDCGGQNAKRRHRIITAAAALANWHLYALGKTNMRPGIEPPAGEPE